MMNRRSLVLLLLLLLIPAAGGAAPPAVTEATPLLGTAQIPDLDRLLSHLETAGSALSPQGVGPGTLKATLGLQLGDPGLAHLGRGPILGMLLGGPGGPRIAILLPVLSGAPYAETLAKAGWKARAGEGVLALSMTPEGLEGAWSLLPAYRAAAQGPEPAHDIRFELQAQRFASEVGPMMEAGIKSMAHPSPKPGRVQAAAPTALLAFEAQAFLAILRSSDTLRWDMDLEGGVLSVSSLLKPRRESPLALLASMPPPGAGNAASAFLPEKGLVTTASAVDPRRVGEFAGKMLDEMAKDPETAEYASPGVRELVGAWGRCSTGQMATSVFLPDPTRLRADSVMTVADEGACLQMIEGGTRLVDETGGLVQKLYGGMGFTLAIALEKGERTHKGVPVHRLKNTLAPVAGKPAGAGPDLSNPIMASAARDTEFAFSHGFYVASQDPARLDALLDLTASAPPAAPGPALLPGANLWATYDLMGLIQAGQALGAANPRLPSAAGLPPAPPVEFALSLGGGGVRGLWRIPVGPLLGLFRNMGGSASPPPAPQREASRSRGPAKGVPSGGRPEAPPLSRCSSRSKPWFVRPTPWA
jgi:hypothetical protein